MKMQIIPGTGLRVSSVCLGTMTFGDQLAEKDAIESVAFAHDHGVNFYDTADIYFRGHTGVSECILGKALKPYRQTAVLATKCGGPMTMDPNDRGLSRRHVISAVEGSLKRLETDYIDLLYFHFPDPTVSPEELLFTANQLIRDGKIRYYGVSNFAAWQLCELILKAKVMNLIPPVVTESVYNLLTRGLEDELLPMLKAHPTGLVVYNPLAGGLLTGKHRKGAPAPDSRFDREKGYAARYFHEENLDAVESLSAIAQRAGCSLIELSLQWLLQSPAVTSVILGYSKLEHLRQNLESVEKAPIVLPTEEIDAVWTALKGRMFSYHQ